MEGKYGLNQSWEKDLRFTFQFQKRILKNLNLMNNYMNPIVKLRREE